VKHARRDYDRIQDPEGKIGEDEPVFLVRAKDKAAPATVRAWADENDRQGGDTLLSQSARDHAERMELWQQKNGCKPADAPDGVVELKR
jgi:hypothetical protein